MSSSDAIYYIGRYLDAFLFVLLSTTCASFLFVIIALARATSSRKAHILSKPDEFEQRNGYTYDYVFVFKVYYEDEIVYLNEFQKKFTLKNFLDRCQLAQIEVKSFFSCQRDEIYIKLRVDPKRLLAEADRIDYKLMLQPGNLKIASKAGHMVDRKYVWKPIVITDEFRISPYDPYEYIFAKYSTDDKYQYLFKQYPANPSSVEPIYQLLRPIDRIKLILSILESNISDTPAGCGLVLNDLIANKAILAHYPLHNYGQLRSLEVKWLQLFSRSYVQPIDEIKDYFGEKIALYFAFLSYMATSLRIPAVIALVVYAYRTYQGKSETFLLPYYSGIVGISISLILELWKKKQARISMEWGMAGFEQDENERTEFEGEDITSPVNGKPMVYYPAQNKWKRSWLVYSVISIFAGIVIAITVGIAYMQNAFNSPGIRDHFEISGRIYNNYVTALILVIIIQLMDRIFDEVAIVLNNVENHRTETQYEDALVGKIFLFKFINSYAYVTFVAFIKPFQTSASCVEDDCYLELSHLLLILTLVPLLIHCIEDAIVRKIEQTRNYLRETSNIEPGRSMGIVEEQYILPEYSALRGILKDYSSICIQYGYALMFMAVFPLGIPIFSLATNLRIRMDGWKFCQAYRRPLPKMAEDIGVWRDVMELISSIAIVYIFALVFFTSHYFEDQPWSMRWVFFLLVEHVALAVKHYIAEAVSDVPESVAMQLERQKFLVSKVFDNEADDADEEYKGLSIKQHSINIQITDDDWEDPSGNDYIKKHIQAYRSITQNDDSDEIAAIEMGLLNRSESFNEESKLPSTPSVSDLSRGRGKKELNEIEAYFREPSRVDL